MGQITAKQRVAQFLEAHEGRWYTPKQVASWLKLTERTVRKHLEALAEAGDINARDD